jgi:AraC family transcriptional regulator
MVSPPEFASPIARVEGGVLRDHAGELCDASARTWGALKVLRGSGPVAVPEGALVDHLLVMNVGGPVECEARIADGPLLPHHLAHHAFSFFPAGLRHEAPRCPPDPLFVGIDPAFADGVLRSAGEPAALHPVIASQDPVAVHVVLALEEEARTAGSLARPRAEALGAALVTRLAISETPAPRPEPVSGLPSARLRRVLDHVAAHLDAPPSLRFMADLAGLDLYRFVRGFKQSTGMSPHQYVLEARVSHAKALLRDPALSITEIALRTGFATPSHFSVTFRRMAGARPRDFRDGRPGPTGSSPGGTPGDADP